MNLLTDRNWSVGYRHQDGDLSQHRMFELFQPLIHDVRRGFHSGPSPRELAIR